MSVFTGASTPRVLSATLGMIGLIAVSDRAIGNRASLGILYILPMVIAATVLRPVYIVALAGACSVLRGWFDIPAPPLEISLRFLFAFAAYAGSGLFVIALMRNRSTTLEHLANIRREQDLRREAEEQLKVLVESSPAAIITVDGSGTVLAANKAAGGLLLLPEERGLKGRPIGGYLPVLSDALQFDPGPAGLRTAAQCQGFRDNGEIFLATLWFSSWTAPEGKRLAAIVVDSSEEMRDREEETLRQLLNGNQIVASAVSHEVRNLCAAIGVVSANLRESAAGNANEDVQALTSLVKALEKIASVELQSRASDTLEQVSLKAVLDDLRIVIEPQWREVGGRVRWRLPHAMPRVLTDPHGLLQALLNLAQNSLRAVQECTTRELLISASDRGREGAGQKMVLLTLEDSGPGVAAPERLFEPFQPGSDGTGLGLYVSRALVRSYGGDLRWEPCASGSRFVLELQKVQEGTE